MTLYRFHVRIEAEYIQDSEGLELPNLTAALQEALRSAREFRAEAEAPGSMHFEIADPAGEIVLRVPIFDQQARVQHH